MSSSDYFKTKSRPEMRRELVDNGLWADFVRARESLKASGESVDRAWRMAFEAVMHPFDDRFDDSEVADYVNTVVESGGSRQGTHKPGERPSVPSPFLDKDKPLSRASEPIREGEVIDVVDGDVHISRPADVIERKRRSVGSLADRNIRKNDVSSNTFSGKSCGTPRTVEWVAANIRVKDASAADAPSSEAWSMLCWVKATPQAEAQFWAQIYTKLMPTRQQLDQESKLKDDGRDVLDLISRIQKSKEESERAGLPGIEDEEPEGIQDVIEAIDSCGVDEPEVEEGRDGGPGSVVGADGSEDAC